MAEQEITGLSAPQTTLNGQVPSTTQLAGQILEDILATEYPPMRWAIPGLLPEGCVIVGGKKGSGKSMLVLNIAMAVAAGGYTLGGIVRIPAGDVLFFDLEGNERRLQKRAQQMRPEIAGETPFTRFTVYFDAPRIAQGLEQKIKTWHDTHPDARLVVLDILARIRPAQQSQNSYQDDYNAMVTLQKLATELHLTILVVTHTRKAPAEDPFDELNATTGLLGAADGGMVLRRARGEDKAFLFVTSRDLENEIGLALEFDRNTALWSIVGSAEEFQRSEARQQVIEVLEQYGGTMTPKAIAEALGRLENTIRQRCKRMAEDGEIVNEGGGLYRVCPTFYTSGNSAS